MTRTIQVTILIVVAMAALALNGCGGKVRAEQPAQVTQAATMTHKDGSPVHLCGFPLKNGGTCKRHVKAEGEVCWMHVDKRPAR